MIATDLADTSDRFRFIACVAELAELLRESYWARDGSFTDLRALLRSQNPAFRATSPWRELDDLVRRAHDLTVARLATP